MDDLISRKVAIAETEKYKIHSGVQNQGTWNECVNAISEMVKELPSAEPQERKGKWIPDYTDCRGEIWVEWKCSCCGFIRTTGWEHSGGEMPTAKFCEECGVRMNNES